MASSAPTTTAPAPTRDNVLVVKCPAGANSVEAFEIIEKKAAASGKKVSIEDSAKCRQLLAKSGVIPKGAPETGGGGMADEVSSWG